MSGSGVGRNDPCPCGSGKKFKKCCGAQASITTPPEVFRANHEKQLDRELVDRIMRYSRLRLGADWVEKSLSAYAGAAGSEIDEGELQIAMPWSIFHNSAPGHEHALVWLYAAEKGKSLSPELQRILDANLIAWLSIWEVTEVERGAGMSVRDLLTGEERFVHEVMGSESINLRSVLLARIVDSNGISFFSGTHPRPLSPRHADAIVRGMKKLCRVRTRLIKPEVLRDVRVQAIMIHLWREVVRREMNAPPPTLVNTEGDPISLLANHYDIVTAKRNILVAKLSSLPGSEGIEEVHGEASITITRHDLSDREGQSTVLARIVADRKRIRVECNSVRRADMMRALIESTVGEMVRYRLREETSLADALRGAKESRHNREELPRQTSEQLAIVKELRERHMAAWPDMQLPVLGGLTPREAAKRPASRAKLEVLLRDMEMSEDRLDAEERFDMDRLRDVLGMRES